MLILLTSLRKRRGSQIAEKILTLTRVSGYEKSSALSRRLFAYTKNAPRRTEGHLRFVEVTEDL